MVKSELIKRIASKMSQLSEKDIELSVNHILAKMTGSLYAGDRIEIRGFGSFSLHYLSPRNAHNPKTGVRIITIPKYTPHFKPGKELRDRINASRQVPIKAEEGE